jgi:hypothetical protein
VATTPEVLPHLDAVQAALESIDHLTVFVGGTPTDTGWTPPTLYAVLYPEPGMAVRESLADERTDFEAVMQITCAGASPEQALWVADKVRTVLAAAPVVEGRVCWPPEDLGGPPLARDDDVTPPVFFLPVQYRICSTPA